MDNLIKLIDLRISELSNEKFDREKELEFLSKFMDYYLLDLKNVSMIFFSYS